MKKVIAALFALTLAGTAAADGDMRDMRDMPGMQGMPGMHEHREHFTFGAPADPAKADRTVKVTALDTMRFKPASVRVRAGETVKFVVTNRGKLRHEFVIGDATEQREHAREMKAMPGMTMHDDANGVSLAPGQTKTIAWRFARPGTVLLACHEPGHYEAGMVARVTVSK